jgi:uncharacterized protein YggE
MQTRVPTLVAAIVIMALAFAAGALGAILGRPRPAAAAIQAPLVRQITAIGRGEVTAVPDTAIVQLGVQTEAETARAALTENNAATEALIAKLKELGVADRDIQTSSFNIWPRYDEKGNTIVGYQVTNLVTVKIRNLNQTGTLLDQVVEVGANNVTGISFTIDNPTALEQQARNQAIADARSRAEAMAQASSVTLGQILTISENIASPLPVLYREAMPAAEAGAAVPVQPGEQSVVAQVQVTFELR